MTTSAPSKNTRDAILDAAQYFVQNDSYDGFSFRDVAQTVGIRKASIYHHFESKEGMAVAMLERGREHLRLWARHHASLSPQERLRGYCFDLYRDQLGAGNSLCPAGAFVGGWSHMPDAMCRAALGVMHEQALFLSTAMADGCADGSLRLPPGCDNKEAAIWFATTVQGALIVSRAHGGSAQFTQLCETTIATLSVRD